MRSWSSKCAVLALSLALAPPLGGCGFSDALTTRGFIKQGDQICIDTIVSTGASLRSRGVLTGSEQLGLFAKAYGDAAVRFQKLEIRSEDEAMRDRVVNRFTSFSDRFRAGSRATEAAARALSADVFSDISSQQAEMRTYGFNVCGGGGGPPISQPRS
jgi:hypothetical protein